MAVPPKHADLQIYFQCRIIGCSARCHVSPKHSGRLGDHWKKEHVAEHGPFNSREVLVKTRNADGAFATTSFDAYAIANGIKYKTQESPRPTQHANTATTTSSCTAAPHAPMQLNSGFPARPTMNSTPVTAQPTSNLRRVARMERQLRIASMPSRLPQGEPSYRDTPDSHPNQPLARRLPQRSASTRLPLKRNLSQAFSDAKSSLTQAPSRTSTAFNFPSAPAPAPTSPKIPFSQFLISHLRPPQSPPPLPRTARNATQALRGTLNLATRVGNGQKKDYSLNTWSCEMCRVDFPDMRSVTVHLRDHHAVEEDVVTLTPNRDVITMVLASVKIDDEEHGWVDERGEVVRVKRGRDDDETESDEEMQAE